MALTKHSTREDLESILGKFYDKPHFLFLYHSIYNQIHNIFPATSIDLYSYEKNGTTYWYAFKKNKYIKPLVLCCCEGKFRAEDFIQGFEKFSDLYKVFEKSEPLLLPAEKCFTDEICKYLESKYPLSNCVQHPCNKFYMSESQRKMVTEAELSTLPPGYELGSATVADAALITIYWKHAANGDVEQTREKIACFPSSCVRYNGSPVAFEIVDHYGNLNHQFVVEEHRRKGLGNIVELDLAKKCIRSNILVNKHVETFNSSVLKSAENSKFWTKAVNEDTSDTIVVFIDIRKH